MGSTGKIEATLEVACLVVLGKVKGILKATERIEIREGGSIEGSVITPVLVIDSGSRFNGDCQMLSLLEQRSKESKTGKVFDIPSEISKSPASSHLSLKDNNKEVERDSL